MTQTLSATDAHPSHAAPTTLGVKALVPTHPLRMGLSDVANKKTDKQQITFRVNKSYVFHAIYLHEQTNCFYLKFKNVIGCSVFFLAILSKTYLK